MTAADASKRMRLLVLGVLIALIGAGVSVYSTMHHLEVKRSGSTDYACNINAKFSCDDIAKSEYSEVMGAPLGVWGFSFFAAIAFILLLGNFYKQNEKESLQAFGLLSIVGVLVSAGLGYISVAKLGTYCVTCIGIYACCLALLLVAIMHWSEIPKPFDLKSLSNGGFSAALVVVVIISAYKFLWPKEPPAMNQTEMIPTTMPQIPISKNQYAGLGEDYRKGSDDAKVVIMEFADFQCPGCAFASKALSTLHKQMGDEILVVFRNYPLDPTCNKSVNNMIHPFACLAAKLARCAGDAGKFWDYHDRVFNNQKDLNEATAKQWAKELGLSDDAINRCISSKDVLAKIEDDVRLGNELIIESTPTIFINGMRYKGENSPEALREAVDKVKR